MVTGVTTNPVTAVTAEPVTNGTLGSVTGDTDPRRRDRHDARHEPVVHPRTGTGRGEEVNQMAEKKVAPKAPAAKSSSTTGKAAATRVTRKKLAKKMKKM